MNLRDLLLPTTDGGVLAQLVVVLVVSAVLLWRFRSHAEGRLMTIGLFLVALAFFGVRALH